MPVRIRITLLFTALVFVILGLVCISSYYFFNNSRIDAIKTRLTNRAITIGRLLNRSDVFSNELVQRIDSSTAMSYTNKVIQAYDYRNNKIYEYTTLQGDSLIIDAALLDDARLEGELFFTIGNKEVVAYPYTGNKSQMVIIASAEDAEGKQSMSRLLHILVLSFSGGLVITFIVGYVFSKTLLQPLKKIADDANIISAQNLSKRIHTGKVKDEWHYLSDTLNLLLNRLQESFDMQKRFVANVSHELSTPLTSISSQLEVSLQRERPAAEYRHVMSSVHQDVLQMSALTQALLEFAKASGSPGGLEIALVRIDELLFRLPSELAKNNEAYTISFELDELPTEQDRLLVYGNEELLFTAVKNIVINGCKYSKNKSAAIKLTTQQEEIVIIVRDKGAGIPETELDQIFQPFYRVHNDDKKEGFGLGLSLASRIVKLHKGEIKVSSKLGEGSIFMIRLPVAKLV